MDFSTGEEIVNYNALQAVFNVLIKDIFIYPLSNIRQKYSMETCIIFCNSISIFIIRLFANVPGNV